MERVLRSSRKKQIQDFFNSPVYGDSACSLCMDGATPSNLNRHISEDSNSKTCGDVHLELSLINEEQNPDSCAAKQELYRSTCCPDTSAMDKMTGPKLSTALGVLIIFILIKRILSLRVRVVAPDDADDGSLPSTSYRQMKDHKKKKKKKKSHAVKEIIVDGRTQLV